MRPADVLRVRPGGADAIDTTVLFVPAPGRDGDAVVARLAEFGLDVTAASTPGDAMRRVADGAFAVCLIDLADDRAATTVRAIRAQRRDLATAGLIDAARPAAAAAAMDAGLADVLPWPFDAADITAMLANARDYAGLALAVPAGVGAPEAAGLLAHSPAMRIVVEEIRLAAAGRTGVLVCGEPGTGRGKVARAIHAHGARRAGPFVEIDLDAGAPADLEWRLFGASADRDGGPARRRALVRLGPTAAWFAAQGGTLFIRNLAELPARLQTKIVRLMRDREARLAGRRAPVALDVRLIAAATPSIGRDVTDGRVRRDLFERVAHARIDVPSLRRRREDIPLLAVGMLREIASAQHREPPRFSRSALSLLAALPWPHNAHELRSLLETLAASGAPLIQIEDVLRLVSLDGLAPPAAPDGSLRDARARFEREWITAVLLKHNGRVGEAARAIGIQRTNLYRKVRQLNVTRSVLASGKPR